MLLTCEDCGILVTTALKVAVRGRPGLRCGRRRAGAALKNSVAKGNARGKLAHGPLCSRRSLATDQDDHYYLHP